MPKLRITLIQGSLAAAFMFFAACEENGQPEPGLPAGGQNQATPETAIAVLYPASGDSARGQITFTQTGDSVRVVADISGLSPGLHGIHIHEYGDCSAPDASSAGGHFNPTGEPHGAPTDPEHHVGDLGNIEAGPDGMAHMEMSVDFLTFSGDESILGRSVVVHAGEDDLTSQPAGNSGPRVACGVIGIAQP